MVAHGGHLPHPSESVELRAEREGDTIVMRLTRSTAEAEILVLETEGWSVEILELAESDRTDGGLGP